ncbi:sensor histidine kinase [Aestuariispira insulae]|uniref:histidine kinase n=1 Tax=Aestuariispira insulae TaxID=1461337 RepID=A0A3D9HN91_9PROT|nr:HAMP domain-containing sensor histidine kinase [Aestuariispira insulae]RED50928.1 signal transduction histidine kinase [Aestuariispira insulae]
MSNTADKLKIQTEDRLRKLLRQAEASLEDSMKRCRQIDRDNSIRIGELAHEIKNPLNAIIGFSEIMMSERFGPLGHDHYREYTELIHSSAQHLLSICEQELSYAKNKATGHEIPAIVEKVDVEVTGLINSTLTDLTKFAEDLGVKLNAVVSEDFPILKTDPTRLKQILYNLVTNAVKFTPEGGEVTVKATVDEIDGAVILVIQDTGFGMAAEDVLKVMAPFEQVEGLESRGDNGSGLGLSISKRLADEMGAVLEIRSQEGIGTLVTLKFPD